MRSGPVSSRRCSRTACGRHAVMTLTYVYADQTAVVGPLATFAEPHSYDLCDQHSERLSAPRGWEVLRLAMDPAAQEPSNDDLLALADAVREAASTEPPERDRYRPVGVSDPADTASPIHRFEPRPGLPTGRRDHLRVLSNDSWGSEPRDEDRHTGGDARPE
ncbi:MAG: DUF3499 domain-containing protein [Nocardioides sp.]